MLPIRIGIAGYTGSGKSIVADLFLQNKIEVLEADSIAKNLMSEDDSIKESLQKSFGDSVVIDASIQFAILGALCFQSKEKLEMLNSIVHPPLKKRIEKLLKHSTKSIVLDAALIPLWDVDDWFDHLFWISAPLKKRVAWLKKRTNLSEDQILQRMQIQESLLPVPQGKKWTVLSNDGTKAELQQKVRDSVSLLAIME